MHLRPFPSHLILPLVCVVTWPASIGARQAPAPAAGNTRPATQPQTPPRSDLDVFMEKVLARREVNRKMLNQYVLDETETFEILGPGQWPLHRTKRDFTWYERDGTHVRSPVRFNGVPVNETERQQYERDWLRREKERQEREAKKGKARDKDKTEVSIGAGGVDITTGGVPTEPRFVSEAYFMDFKFEPGNYYLAGREKLEGQDVLRIEYYPTNLFNDEDDEKTPREMKGKKRTEEQKEKNIERDINRKMNKTAMVTLWVDPAEHQIVKYTFDNVWLDFLPAAWLVRIDDLRASMTMGQPFPGVWLPRNINIHAGLTLALGSFEASYGRAFTDYREAQVTTKIKIPKLSSRSIDSSIGELAGLQAGAAGDVAGHGPFVPEGDQQPATETIREIRVHGNAAVTDADVVKLAGIAVGDPLTPDSLKLVEKRLKDSNRFETIEVRKRYRSIDDPTDVAIVLLVHERPGVMSAAGGGITRRSRALHHVIGDRLMFFPILSYDDGYGFTYGVRASTVDLLGMGERLSTPLTWGGTKRAALEFERTFKSGPLTRVFSSFGVWKRENPHYDIGDTRVELKARAERQIAHLVRLGVDTSRSSVSFGQLDDQIWTVGTNAVLDTRGDPAFPGNAIVLGAGWSRLNVRGRDRINRYNTDTRGYLRVVRQAVLAGRYQYFTSDAALPPYEQLLMGGSSNLRGFRTGTYAGDRMIVTSAELRVPITSVISGAKFGVDVFTDASKVADFGARLQDAEWRRGAGAGIFIIAPLVKINLDVAHGFNGGGTRFSLGTGFSF